MYTHPKRIEEAAFAVSCAKPAMDFRPNIFKCNRKNNARNRASQTLIFQESHSLALQVSFRIISYYKLELTLTFNLVCICVVPWLSRDILL